VHCYEDLITLFHECFFLKYNTQVVRGGDEPEYLPADGTRPHHEIFFAHGFFSSALHEISHWLIAGKERRQLVDFGYWYEPDGRNQEQQALFQNLEVKPQAIEWILSMAAGYRFQVSLDNLHLPDNNSDGFKEAILAQVQAYCEKGLPERTAIFRSALCKFYQTNPLLSIDSFSFA